MSKVRSIVPTAPLAFSAFGVAAPTVLTAPVAPAVVVGSWEW